MDPLLNNPVYDLRKTFTTIIQMYATLLLILVSIFVVPTWSVWITTTLDRPLRTRRYMKGYKKRLILTIRKLLQ